MYRLQASSVPISYLQSTAQSLSVEAWLYDYFQYYCLNTIILFQLLQLFQYRISVTLL